MAKKKAGPAAKKNAAESSETERRLRKMDRLLDEMNAETKRREEMESAPAAVILRARELDAKKKYFHRKIVERIPFGLFKDTLRLECGHTDRVFASLVEDGPRRCVECMEDWLLRNARRAKRGVSMADQNRKRVEPAPDLSYEERLARFKRLLEQSKALHAQKGLHFRVSEADRADDNTNSPDRRA